MTVDFPTLLGLLEGVGLSEDPAISQFVPYLRSLTTLPAAASSSAEGSSASGWCSGCSRAAEQRCG